jgi:esterase/lipase superfamily enzyme
MLPNLAQFALISTLLMNWDGIRLRMEPISPELADELNKIAARLQTAESPDEIANILDDLLDLTRGTAAYAYVQGLAGRSAIPDVSSARDYEVRGISEGPPILAKDVGTAPTPAEGQGEDAAAMAIESSRILGTLISVESDIARVPIFFATNRAKTTSLDTPFSGESASEIFYGLAPVTIPIEKHKTGHVESPHWWNLFPAQDKEHRFVLLEGLESLTPSAFATRLESLLQAADAKDLLVFLHGYNVTFEEGARRAAQIAYDMKFPGAVILFSWPSAGTVMAYPKDEEEAFASADRFATFLKSLEGGPWNRVHIVAHSMGNRVMLLGLADNQRPKLPLGQIVLTAADVYVPLFQEKFPKLLAAGRLPTTSYASNRDVALWFSSQLHRGSRVGLISGEPFVAAELDTIDASAVDTGFLGLGHSYFSEKRSLITDLRLLLYNSLTPKDRGLTAAKNYWLFPK